jgi:formyl-CoA transferase
MMALHARERTGKGQVVDAALYESVLAVMENVITEYGLTGYIRERSGSILPGIAPSNAYPCAGGEMVVIGGNGDTVYARLCEAMQRPDLAADPKFVDHASRGVNQAELDAIVAGWTRGFSADDLLRLLEEKGVPSGRIFTPPDMSTDPQYLARESIVEVEHPVFGPIKMQNAFPKLSMTPGKVKWPGPALGQHTDAVLSEIAGFDGAGLASLRAKGVI